MRPASLGSHLKRLRPAAAHSRPLLASGSHVCGPRSVFSDAHVAGKNRSDLIRGCGRELCEAFIQVEHLLPLPLGEVAERSEDGEGKQWPARRGVQKAARPSQSPSVTALPEGEPRPAETQSNETRFAGLSFEEIAARCSALAAAFSVRLARLRAEECFFRRACRRKKQI